MVPHPLSFSRLFKFHLETKSQKNIKKYVSLSYRYGPHFDDLQKEGNITFRTVQVGGSIYLNCRISFLQGKTVSPKNLLLIYFL